MTNNILNVVQGEQYAIPIPIYLGTELVTPDNVEAVRVQINNTLKEWPSDEPDALTYDDTLGAWLWPITEEMSRAWPPQHLPAQVGINLGGGEYRYSHRFEINVAPNIIDEEWS